MCGQTYRRLQGSRSSTVHTVRSECRNGPLWSTIMNKKIKHNGKGKTETAALCHQGISRWISCSGCKSAVLLHTKWQDVFSPNAGYSDGKELLRLQKRKGRVGRQPRGNHWPNGRGSRLASSPEAC